jgi:hypothetical protein
MAGRLQLCAVSAAIHHSIVVGEGSYLSHCKPADFYKAKQFMIYHPSVCVWGGVRLPL